MSSAPLSSEVPALSPAIATDAEHIASSTDSTSSSKGKEPGSAIQPQDQKQPPHPEQKPRREGQEPLAADSTEGTPLPDSSVVHPQTQGNILDQTTGAGASSNPTPSHILSSSSHPSNPAGSRPQMSKQNPPVKITLVPAAQDSEKDQDGVVRGQTPTTESGVSPATKQETHKTKPLSPSSSEVKRVKSPVKHKQSFWSSLFAGLLPCISPSKAHPVDIEHLQAPRDSASTDAVSGARKAQVVSLQDAKEKEAGAEADKHSTEPSTSTSTTTPAPLQIPRSTTPLYDPELPLHTAPPTPTRSSIRTGGHVIVPPSPHHLLPEAETEGLTSGAVQPPGSTGRESEDLQFGEGEEGAGDELRQAEEEGADGTVGGGGTTIGEGTVIEEDDEERLILQGGVGIPIVDGQPRPLLPPVSAAHAGRKCLVLDMDETLLHSSFKLIPQSDYVIPVEIEWQWHNVYVIKRPGVDAFLKRMGELYEVVVFTASLSKYADPVLDKLDIHKVVTHRLFRESCYNHKGNYVKDLSQLGRPMNETIILDNSPASYIFHPNNAVPVSSWFNDPHDTELTDLTPFLADLCTVDDIRGVLDGGL